MKQGVFLLSTVNDDNVNESGTGQDIDLDDIVPKGYRADVQEAKPDTPVTETKVKKKMSFAKKAGLFFGIFIVAVIVAKGAMAPKGSGSVAPEQPNIVQEAVVSEEVTPVTSAQPQVYEEQNEIADDLSGVVAVADNTNKVTTFVDSKEYLNTIQRDSWVHYENGFLGWSVEYPKTWYMEDAQADALTALDENGINGGNILDFNSSDIKTVIPVMTLTADSATNTKLVLAVVPSKSETTNKVHNYIVPKGYKVQSSKAYDVGTLPENKLNVVPFTLDNGYTKEYGVQSHIMGTKSVLMAHIVSDSKEALKYYSDLYMKQVTGSLKKLGTD